MLADAVQELKRVRPDFSCRFAHERLFYVKDAAQLDVFIDGLRRAGINE